MAVSHLLLFTVTSAQLRHTSFAFLGCGWWLVVWWLVVGVVGGCCWWWWWPGVWHEISAPPNDTYESKMASPIIRTKMAYKRTRFFNPSGPWVGPRGPEGPKNFLGVCMLSPWALKKSLETHPIWSSLVSFREFEAKNRTCVPGVPLYSLTTEQTRKYHIIITPMYAYTW